MLAHNEAKVIYMGDFNTTFSIKDRQNTVRGGQEIRIANYLNDYFLRLDMFDCWSPEDTRMTWRHGIKMSKIDRIFVSNALVRKSIVQTDWSLTESDH